MTVYAVGIDYSGWQHPQGRPIDFPALRAAGVEFGICKASEGSSTNPYFVGDTTASAAAGMAVGAYAFTRPDVGPAEGQADVFSELCGQAPRLDMWADDAETGGSVGAAGWADWHGRFCERVAGALPGIADAQTLFYSGAWCQRFGWGFDSRVTRRSLWLAQYGGAAPGPLPGWSVVSYWQDRDNQVYPGILGGVDRDLLLVPVLGALNGPPTRAHTGLAAPMCAAAPTPTGLGSWSVARDGGLWPYGDAPTLGGPAGAPNAGHNNLVGVPHQGDVVGFAPCVRGGGVTGYWMVTSAGQVFAFGGAGLLGDAATVNLAKPVCGMAATADGTGYWLVMRDGGVFPYGSAGGLGSLGGKRLNAEIVGMAPTQTGQGYWLVAADGGVFPFGDAFGYGSTGNLRLNAPCVGLCPVPAGGGYWLVGGDGGVFPFGPSATGWGSAGAVHLNAPAVSLIAGVAGYRIVCADGGTWPFGPVPPAGGSLA